MSHYRGGELLSLLLKGGMSEFRKRMKNALLAQQKVKAKHGKEYGYSYKCNLLCYLSSATS